MWPVELYSMGGGSGFGLAANLVTAGGGLEAYRSITPLVRMGIQFVGAALVVMLVLGLFQGYGTQSVAKSRGSPVISICIGLPSVLIVSALTSTGFLIVDTSVGTFFAIPLVILGVAVLPTATAIGLVAIGRTVATRLGDDRLAVGILVGAVLSGIAGVSLLATVALAGVAASLGGGATIRVLFGAGGTTNPDERTVPPANKI